MAVVLPAVDKTSESCSTLWAVMEEFASSNGASKGLTKKHVQAVQMAIAKRKDKNLKKLLNNPLCCHLTMPPQEVSRSPHTHMVIASTEEHGFQKTVQVSESIL